MKNNILVTVFMVFVLLLPLKGEGEKKIEFVISSGISLLNPESLVIKNNGIDSSVSQYAESIQYNYKTVGKFKNMMTGLPISITVNYRLSNDLYLKFGGEYETIGNSYDKTYSISWPSFTEKMSYTIENSIKNIIPFVGIEKRFSSFGIYGIIGLNITSFVYKNILDLSGGSYNLKKITDIKANGKGIALYIGAKYMIKLKKKFGFLIKAEYVYRTIGSFSGKKSYKVSDSVGGDKSVIESGDLYMYDLDPYGKGSFKWWDMHKGLPNKSNIKNVESFSLNHSSIRIMLGFTF